MKIIAIERKICLKFINKNRSMRKQANWMWMHWLFMKCWKSMDNSTFRWMGKTLVETIEETETSSVFDRFQEIPSGKRGKLAFNLFCVLFFGGFPVQRYVEVGMRDISKVSTHPPRESVNQFEMWNCVPRGNRFGGHCLHNRRSQSSCRIRNRLAPERVDFFFKFSLKDSASRCRLASSMHIMSILSFIGNAKGVANALATVMIAQNWTFLVAGTFM